MIRHMGDSASPENVNFFVFHNIEILPQTNQLSSRLNIHVKFLYTLPLIFLFASCAPEITPPSDIPDNPKVAESARPDLQKAQDNIDKGINENTQQQGKVDEAVAALIEQKLEISEALTQAEKIKEKALAKINITEIEAFSLVNQLKKVEARNLFLEIKVNELDGLTIQQAKTLIEAKKKAEAAMQKSIDKEIEAKEAQEKLTQVKKSLTQKNEEVVAIQKQKEKLIKQKADAMVYKKLFWYTIGIYILLLIVKNVWMSVNPAARLRW